MPLLSLIDAIVAQESARVWWSFLSQNIALSSAPRFVTLYGTRSTTAAIIGHMTIASLLVMILIAGVNCCGDSATDRD